MKKREAMAAEEVICGVKMSELDLKRAGAYVKTLGLKLAPKVAADPAEVVAAIAGHLAKEYKGKADELGECDVCGGASPLTLEECPFCGEEGQGDESGEDSNDEGEESAAASDSGEESESEVATSLPDSARTLEASRRHETALALRGGSLSALAQGVQPGELVPRMESPTRDAYEDAVGQCQIYRRNWQRNAWELGKQVARLSVEGPDRPALWTLALEDDGTQKYKHFRDFVRGELGMSHETAISCRYIFTHYRPEEVEVSASTKIGIILSAPAKERKQLLEQAKTMNVRDLREQVRDLKLLEGKKLEQEGKKDPNKKRREARQERAKVEHAVKDEKKGVFTFVMEKGKTTRPLFKLLPDKNGKLVSAASFNDACGWLEGTNGTKLKFRLMKTPTGKHQIVFEPEREVEAAE
jgi:hypothetical protein